MKKEKKKFKKYKQLSYFAEEFNDRHQVHWDNIISTNHCIWDLSTFENRTLSRFFP